MFICLYIFIESLVCANEIEYFNFPMQKSQTNLIYLQQYTQEEYYPPFYQINGQNSFNLSLIQSVQQIYNNQSTTTINNIICVSNYIVESGTTSNVFWMLANNLELYSGVIDEFGRVSIEKINVMITANNCYNINLINQKYGFLTCTISLYLSFVSVNTSSLGVQSYQSSYNSAFSKIFTFMSINNANNFTISAACINQNALLLLTFILNNNQLSLSNSTSFAGSYVQVCSSKDLNYYLLLSQNTIQYYTLSSNLTGTVLQFSTNVYKIAMYQLSDNYFQLALLSNQLVQLYYLYSNFSLGFNQKPIQVIVQVPTNVQIFQMNKLNMFILADNFIAVLQIDCNLQEQEISMSVSNYLNINLNIQSSIINEDRFLAVIFSTNSINQQLSTYYFTNPQIPITLNQQNQILSSGSSLQLNISVTSQLSQLLPTYFILNLVSVDYTISQCPIQTQVNQSNLNIQYPTYTTIPFSNIYQGPFLTPTIQSTNQNYVQVYTNNQQSTVNNYQFTQQTYQVLCAYQFAIPIYCTQYQNYSVVISQWFSTQTIVTNPQTNQNLTSCNCFIQNTGIVAVVMQFQQQIIIQQLLPFFDQSYQNVINFNQQIVSSGVLMNSLFVITSDSSLYCYEIYQTTSQLFNYTGQQFKEMYINEESYPNYLFIDNTTNLIILSYNGQNSFEIINQIPYPITSYTSSSFGILNNGIYLTLLTTTGSQLYYYPKDYIFLQISNQLYYQVSLFGYNVFGPKIVSSFTSSHFYLVTLTSANACCQILIFQGTGSAFTSPTSIQPMQVSTFSTFNAVTKTTANIDLVYYYQANSNSQKSFNFSVPTQGSYILIPYYVNGTNNVSTNVNFANNNCSQSVLLNVTIMYQQQQISALPLTETFGGDDASFTYSQYPNLLFSGNLENFSATCQNCTSLSLEQPIRQLYQPLNISYQAAMYYLGQLYVQDNLAIYSVSQTGQLKMISSIPGQNQICSYLFVEQLSKFFVSICYQNTNTYLNAFNKTGNQTITIYLALPAQFKSAIYSSGILKIVSQSSNYVTNYLAYYIWIANNTVNLSQIISQLNLFTNSNFQFISLYEPYNFTNNPCSTFGLTSQQQLMSFNIPVFYIVQTCISSSLSQAFGFSGNNYTTNTVEYFTIQDWNIFSLLPPFQNQIGSIIQSGNTLSKEGYFEAQFIVPYQSIAYRYFVRFNSSNGNITSFWQANSLYIISSYDNNQYQMYQQAGPLLNIEGLSNSSTVNICLYPTFYGTKYNAQIIYTIGCVEFNNFNQALNRGIYGNYFLIVDQSTQNTIVFYLQMTILMQINTTRDPTSSIFLTASNQIGSATQTIKVINNMTNMPDEDENIDDGNNKPEKGSIVLILVIMVVLLIAVTAYFNSLGIFKDTGQYKTKKQMESQPLYEMG